MSNEKEHQGVVVVLHTADKSKFLVQRKDSGYPIPSLARTVCLFGGAVEASETPYDAILREVREEIGLPQLRDSVLSQIEYRFSPQRGDLTEVPKTYRLPSVKNIGNWFNLTVYYAIIEERLARELDELIYQPGAILEGYGEVVTRNYLRFLVDEHPEDCFSSLATVIKDFVTT